MATYAEPLFDKEEDQYVPSENINDNVKLKALGLDGMPAYPEDKNLRQLNIRQTRLIYYIDLTSIRSSKKTNIASLVVVAISPNGARTVAYEGFDCGFLRYQPYGYASSDGPIRPFVDQGWKPVIDEGGGRYRRTLIDDYLCDQQSYAASRKRILTRLQDLKGISINP